LKEITLKSKIIENTWFHILILFVICYTFYFFQLGSQDLYYAEAREGKVVLEMNRTGNIILPLTNGTTIPSKPPFFHWIGLIVSKITGSVDEFSIRFPSAFFGTLGIIITYLLGKEIFNKRVGFLSAIFLATTITYVKLSRGARVDMTLSFFILLSLLFFLLGYKYEHRRKLFFILYFVSASFATMAKGPVGIVLPSIIVFIFLITKKELKIMALRKEVLIGILIFLIISSSWYILALLKGGEEFFQKQIMKENINRFSGGGEGGYGHEHPFYFLFPRVFNVMFPWSLFLPAVIYSFFLKNNREKLKENKFFIIWFLSVLIFFSISVSKRAEYLLPLIPAGTILIANLWDDPALWDKRKLLNWLMKIPVFLFTFLAIPSSLIIITSLVLYSFGITIPDMLHNFLKPRDFIQTSFYCSLFYKGFVLNIAVALLGILWAIYTIKLLKGNFLLKSLYSLMVFLLLITNIICIKYHPAIWGNIFVKDFAIEIKKSLNKEDKLYFYNLEKNGDLKHNIYHGLVFYTERHLKDLSDKDLSSIKNQNLPVYLIAENKYFNRLIKQGFKVAVMKESKLIDFQYKLFLVKLMGEKA